MLLCGLSDEYTARQLAELGAEGGPVTYTEPDVPQEENMSELRKLRELCWVAPFGSPVSALLALDFAGLKMDMETLPDRGASLELGIVDGDVYTLHRDGESGQYYLSRELAAKSCAGDRSGT
jgi:hypothetical protein